MTNVRRARLWVLCCLAVAPWPAAAQTSPTDTTPAGPPPAHITYIDGRVSVDRDGQSTDAAINMPLADGDRLRVEDGRVEVMLPDGSLLHLDEQTVADALAPDLWRLLRGRVQLVVRRAREVDRTMRYQIDAPAASVRTDGPGEFRIWAGDTDRGRDVELAVSRGDATLANEAGAETARAGERVYAREGQAPSTPQYFNSARWDEFGRWSAVRRDANLGAASARYLPDDLDVYAGTLDRYGTWRSDPSNGYVWYPTVAADWRPYSVGYWRQYPTWGSFWIGGDPWGWPTHHYGRWGFSAGVGWYWRPSTAWAPAWVYWAISPGYVSWCALGYNDYPVYGNWGVHGAYSGHGHDPWRGWTVMPRHHYGAGMPVHRYAVDGRGLPPSERGAFVAQRPAPTGFAVPRSYASGTAVPRGSGGTASQPPGGAPNSGAVPRGSRGTEAPRANTPRTSPPAATPDVTAFGSRRQATARPSMDRAPGEPANGAPESRYRARALPDSLRSVFPPAAGASPSSRQPATTAPRGGRAPDAQTTAPRSGGVPPSSRREGAPAAPPRYVPRQGAPRDESPRTQAPRAAAPRSEAPREAAPRSQAPRAAAPRTQAPRVAAPRSAAPRSEAPRYQAPARSERSAPGGAPSYRPAPSSRGSSGTAAPRYNPGAESSRSRSGGSAPPARRRGGAPGQ